MSYRRPPPQRVENYTGPFLATLGVLLFMAFFTIAAVAGFVWVILLGAAIDRVIRLIGLRIGP